MRGQPTLQHDCFPLTFYHILSFVTIPPDAITENIFPMINTEQAINRLYMMIEPLIFAECLAECNNRTAIFIWQYYQWK